MSSKNVENLCAKCLKAGGHVFCSGCEEWFCFKHLFEHRQELATEFDQISVYYDELQYDLINKEFSPDRLLDRINAWEKQSIEQIQQAATAARDNLNEHFHRKKQSIEKSLSQIKEELRMNHEQENYSEIQLKKWTDQLHKLRQQFDAPSDITVLHDQNKSSESIPLIRLKIVQSKNRSVEIDRNSRWSPNAFTIAGGHSSGPAINQLHYPYGIDMDSDGNMLIADCENHRIVRWKRNATQGELVLGGKGPGAELDQLRHPLAVLCDRDNDRILVGDYGNRRILSLSCQKNRSVDLFLSDIRTYGLAIDDEHAIYVSDSERNEVLRFRPGRSTGTVVAGGNGKGAALNQLNGPRNIFVDSHRSIYISDMCNHRVVKWLENAKEGILVAGGNDSGSARTQLNSPSGLFVDEMESLFIVDQSNHRVMRWLPQATEGIVLAGIHGKGSQSNQLDQPAGLYMDSDHKLYVADRNNHRIQVFLLE